MESRTQSETNFRYFKPAKRRATQYEEVTLHTQWSPKNYAVLGWFNRSTYDGRPMWSDDATRLQASDWWGYRDPAQQWNRSYVDSQAKQEQAIELAIEGAKRDDRFAEITPLWRNEILAKYYAAYRYAEYGYFLCYSYMQREAPSDVVANTFIIQGIDKDRHAQAISLYGMDLEEAIPGFSDAEAQSVWMNDPMYQPSREYVERLLACRDWGEITVATNLLWEPLVAMLFTREFLGRFAPRHGDPVTWVILETVAVDRRKAIEATAELARFLIADQPDNRVVIQEWLNHWGPLAARAAQAFAPLFERTEERPTTFATAWQRVAKEWRARLTSLGLTVPQEVLGQ